MQTEHPLKTWRENANLTLAQLGERLGVSAGTVCRWELRTRQPEIGIWPKLREVTSGDIPPEAFWPVLEPESAK